MKLTTVIGAAIAALSLAACGSTATPTARPSTPTVAPTPTPTATTTPTATPTPSATPKGAPTLVLTETCDGSANADNFGSVSFTGNIPGFDFVAYGPGLQGGWAGATTADASGDGTVSDLNTGDYEFTNFAPADSPGTLTGSFTIVACPTPTITYCTNGGSLGVGFPCPGVTFKTACLAGDPGVGSVTFTFTQGKTELGDVPDSITFDGNVVDVDGANPFYFGPTNAGTHPVIADGYDLSVTIPACA